MNNGTPSRARTDITPGKGKKGENCNRTACQKPKSAEFLHRDIDAHYCHKCAFDINKFAKRVDGIDLFPNHPEV